MFSVPLISCPPLITYPAFSNTFPSFVFMLYGSLQHEHYKRNAVTFLTCKSASLLLYFVSPSLFDFLLPLSSPVISPPCGLRSGYAVLSHVKIHCMLIPNQHAFPLCNENTFSIQSIQGGKKKYMIQANDIVIPLTEQPRVCEYMHAFVDVQERDSSNKM